MPDKLLIERKLQEIIKQLKHLKELVKISAKTFLSDDVQMYFAERVMQRMIEAAIDINMHIASDKKWETPDSYFHSFIALADLKIYSRNFGESIAPSAKMRNIIVHEYLNLDIKKFKEALDSALRDYPKYVKHIQKFLRSPGR